MRLTPFTARLIPAALITTLAVSGCAPAQAIPPTPTVTAAVVTTSQPTITTDAYTAATLLAKLRVSDTAPTVKYARSSFKHWTDADRNGCNTRAEVLIAESKTPAKRKSATSCTIATGTWISAYDGLTVTTGSKMDVDHMVPLAEAWRSGADKWDATTREHYANDLGYAPSLIAVSASSNRSKSDQDPATWLPTVTAYRCTYVATWVAVKYRWNLTVDTAEKTAITSVLKTCPASATALKEPPTGPGVIR